MYTKTAVGNGCFVTEKAWSDKQIQHIVESTAGFIIRIVYDYRCDCIRVSSVCAVPGQDSLISYNMIPSGSFSALRAVVTAHVRLAKLHNLDRRRY